MPFEHALTEATYDPEREASSVFGKSLAKKLVCEVLPAEIVVRELDNVSEVDEDEFVDELEDSVELMNTNVYSYEMARHADPEAKNCHYMF